MTIFPAIVPKLPSVVSAVLPKSATIVLRSLPNTLSTAVSISVIKLCQPLVIAAFVLSKVALQVVAAPFAAPAIFRTPLVPS